jgi:hypothetical protein
LAPRELLFNEKSDGAVNFLSAPPAPDSASRDRDQTKAKLSKPRSTAAQISKLSSTVLNRSAVICIDVFRKTSDFFAVLLTLSRRDA